jgi:hypothetical protein
MCKRTFLEAKSFVRLRRSSDNLILLRSFYRYEKADHLLLAADEDGAEG